MPTNASDSQVFSLIDEFESAHFRGDSSDFARFLPAEDHPAYTSVLRELIRVDLEFSWQNGSPNSLDYYQTRFPDLFKDDEARAQICFEEYRLRLQAGQEAQPMEYEERYAIEVSSWPIKQPEISEDVLSTVAATCQENRAESDAESDPTKLKPGQEFLGFHLVERLGQGAFGQVFLAKQDRLADRPVTLKIGAGLFSESQTLALLQHTNIVPIHSVHRRGGLQAVCMPYLGSTTLALVLNRLRQAEKLPRSGKFLVDLLPVPGPASRRSTLKERLEGCSYVDAVLEIAVRLAAGLHHAHARGIIHRDLKPANILLSDDAEPMLLDFNLSENQKTPTLSSALMGGTLPYMAPEQLLAFQARQQNLDARSDLYSLGIILFELLTIRFPFAAPTGPKELIEAEILADRQRKPPPLRELNPAVSPALESIVRHCLEPDVARRYQSAEQLETDLRCQLESRPLRHAPDRSPRERTRKWIRRHPRLASSATVGVIACVMLLGGLGLFVLRGQRLARLETARSAETLLGDIKVVQFLGVQERAFEARDLAALIERSRNLSRDRYLVADDQERIGARMGDLLLIAARLELNKQNENPKNAGVHLQEALRLNHMAEQCYSGQTLPNIFWKQRGEILSRQGNQAAAQAALDQATSSAGNARDLGLLAAEQALIGQYERAIVLLEKATRLEPQDFRLWFDLGSAYEVVGKQQEAGACFNACVALAPEFAPVYFKRGLTLLRRGDYGAALADFDLSIRNADKIADSYAHEILPQVHLHRAIALLGTGATEDALAAINQALTYEDCPTRAHFIRARILEAMNEGIEAGHARQRGLELTPTDEMSWRARASARMADNPEAALEDLDQALARNPSSRAALQTKAHVLSERLGRPADAIPVLDRLVELQPKSASVRGGRGVLLARTGKRDGALLDGKACLRLDSSPKTLYQVGCIYALTSREQPSDREEAFLLLAAALAQGYGAELIVQDRDLDPLRALPEFGRLRALASKIR